MSCSIRFRPAMEGAIIKISSAYRITNLCLSNINKLLRLSKYTANNAGESTAYMPNEIRSTPTVKAVCTFFQISEGLIIKSKLTLLWTTVM